MCLNVSEACSKAMVVQEKCGIMEVLTKYGEKKTLATLEFDTLGQAFEKLAHL